MSTVQRSARGRRVWDRPTPSEQTPARRRWLLPMGLVAGGLALLVWFLPALFAATGLLNRVLSVALTDLDGTVSVRSASLGWLSPIRLYDVTMTDDQDQLVADVRRVEVGRPLLALLVDQSHLGTIEIDRPRLELVVRDDGSNLEDVLAGWLTDDTEENEATELPSLDLKLEDGQISVVDESTQRRWQLEKLACVVNMTDVEVRPILVRSTGTLSEANHSGNYDLEAQISLDPAGGKQRSSLSLKTQQLPISVAETMLRRFAPGMQLEGRLTTNVTSDWLPGESPVDEARVDGRIQAEQFVLAGPWLGNDQLRLDNVTSSCAMNYRTDQLDVEQLTAACDLGSASFRGRVNLIDGLMATLRRETYEVQAKVDLAQLAAALPETIQVRDDTHITAGQIQLRLASTAAANGPTWQGSVETSNLVATAAGRPVTWEQPILIRLAAHEEPAGLTLDDLYCESDFLELQASGAPDFLMASASYDLDRLAAELSRFVDLGELKLGGDGWLHATWQRRLDGRFSADAELQVAAFELSMPQLHPWTEDQLELILAATGQVEETTLQSIQTAQVELNSAGDHAELRLRQPIADWANNSRWPVEVELQGSLEEWVPRLEPLIGPLEGYDLAGACEMTAAGQWADGVLDVERSWLTVRPFLVQGGGLTINEPELRVQTALHYDTNASRMELTGASLNTAALSAQTQRIEVAMPADGTPSATGTVQFQGDMARLTAWQQDAEQPADYQVTGRLQGNVSFEQQPGKIAAKVSALINELAAQWTSGESWREPRVELRLNGTYETADDVLKMDELALVSNALGCTATGRLDDVTGRRQLDVSGHVQYDLNQLKPLLQTYTGPDVQVAGRGAQPFYVRGPLTAPPEDPEASILLPLQAEAAVGWSSIDAYGLRLGQGRMDTRLADGLLHIAPLNLPASEGRLQFGPTVRLAPGPMLVTHDPGRVIDRVRITPEMCNQALQYIAPALAGVAKAEGRFSIDLDGAQLPIDDPAQSDVGGRFVVHSVEIGPGPLTQELAVLLNRASAARLSRESVVTFRMVNGRVYHRDLELVFPDLTIRTHGSVGVDRTLAILAEMPVPPKWIGNNPLGDALRNQTIRLPIAGTLDKPQIDRHTLNQLSADFIRRAAGDAVRDQLNRGLDRLFQDR